MVLRQALGWGLSVRELFEPQARYETPISSILVLNRGVSPSSDIYLRERLQNTAVPVTYADTGWSVPELWPLFREGTFVIVVRYLNRRAARLLQNYRNRLSGVAYLMDDDIPAAAVDRSLPLPYLTMLRKDFSRQAKALAGLCSEVWLTSDGLEAKYGGPGVRRIDPMYLGSTALRPAAQPQSPIRIFYHATSTHREDAFWLRGVIEKVQSHRKDTQFEIFGRDTLAQHYAGLPRTEVLKPKRWAEFIDYTQKTHLDIGLAPLSDTPFNDGRSFNKLFDITRCGAAGIYADRAPYAGVVEEGQTGLLRPHDPDAWVAAILDLAEKTAKRRAIYERAVAFCRANNDKERRSPVFARFFDPPATAYAQAG
ncbi:MAG: hypothetical protein ACPGO3_02100 [Magnetospiraceae bacterium]